MDQALFEWILRMWDNQVNMSTMIVNKPYLMNLIRNDGGQIANSIARAVQDVQQRYPNGVSQDMWDEIIRAHIRPYAQRMDGYSQPGYATPYFNGQNSVYVPAPQFNSAPPQINPMAQNTNTGWQYPDPINKGRKRNLPPISSQANNMSTPPPINNYPMNNSKTTTTIKTEPATKKAETNMYSEPELISTSSVEYKAPVTAAGASAKYKTEDRTIKYVTLKAEDPIEDPYSYVLKLAKTYNYNAIDLKYRPYRVITVKFNEFFATMKQIKDSFKVEDVDETIIEKIIEILETKMTGVYHRIEDIVVEAYNSVATIVGKSEIREIKDLVDDDINKNILIYALEKLVCNTIYDPGSQEAKKYIDHMDFNGKTYDELKADTEAWNEWVDTHAIVVEDYRNIIYTNILGPEAGFHDMNVVNTYQSNKISSEFEWVIFKSLTSDDFITGDIVMHENNTTRICPMLRMKVTNELGSIFETKIYMA